MFNVPCLQTTITHDNYKITINTIFPVFFLQIPSKGALFKPLHTFQDILQSLSS